LGGVTVEAGNAVEVVVGVTVKAGVGDGEGGWKIPMIEFLKFS